MALVCFCNQRLLDLGRADDIGGLIIYLDNELKIEIFPDDSLQQEFWRFIIFKEDSEHFVVYDD